MTHQRHDRLVLIAFLSVLCLAAGRAVAQPGIDPRIDDRVIVHVRPEATIAQFIAAFETNNPTVGLAALESIDGRGMHYLEASLPPDPTPAFLDQLENDLETSYAGLIFSGEFLYENQSPEGKTGSIFTDSIAMPNYRTQYGLGQIGISFGRASAHDYSTGAGTVIAVLDTGVDASHPELAGRVLPGVDLIDNDNDPADVGNMSDDDGDGLVDEMTGHGTFVAGLVHLVAPDAKILPIRVLNSDGVGDGWTLTKGLYEAIDRGVEVINLSLGSTYDTATVERAVQEAAALGIPVFASAGNFNRSEPREYQAMGEGLGVAATDWNDVKASFSNYSDRLFISAPGDAGADPNDPSSTMVSTLPGGGYGSWEGTSFAAPLVSGAAALIRSQHPDWQPDINAYIQMKATLAASAVNIYPLNPQYADEQQLGVGRLDALAAVQLGAPAPALGDLNADGNVNSDDLFALLGDWSLTHSSADLNGDGVVDASDLFELLGNWSN